jgi:hypothetical protein
VLTGILMASCVLMVILFLVLASWMEDHALHLSAQANLMAAACCAVSAAVVPLGGQTLAAMILVLAAVLGATGFNAARLGHS